MSLLSLTLFVNDFIRWRTPSPESNEKYSRLIRSLPKIELDALNRELGNISDREAKNLGDRINKGENACLDTSTTRKVVIIALKALKLGYISVEQMASIQIRDAAIRDLKTHVTLFHVRELDETPTNIQQPILKRFFAFTDSEWDHFRKIMRTKPLSEQKFSIMNVPKMGHWSGIVSEIQKVTKLCRSVELPGKSHVKKMVVPSFSMLQAVLDVKAKTLGRFSLKLIPTYNFLDPKDYVAEKKKGGIPVSLYFPEESLEKRYNMDNPNFKGEIDGWKGEGPLAAIFHDFYHGLRELAMPENIAKVRYRLASIAKEHACNQRGPGYREVSDILEDGELIFSVSGDDDTIFDDREGDDAETFGYLFYCASLGHALHPLLKKAFIRDMVDHAEIWRNEFNLGREDLERKDQRIYDRIKYKLPYFSSATTSRASSSTTTS